MVLSDDVIEQKNREFKGKYFLMDNALSNLFNSMKENKRIEEVLIKVTALDSLYSTNINSYKKLKAISEVICETNNIDVLIGGGEKEAVRIIGQTREWMDNAFVFASKYCSFHQPEKFLIFDSYSWLALRTICNELGIDHKLKSNPTMDFDAYKNYCDCVNSLIIKCDLRSGYKKIDEFLWLKSKELLKSK